MKLLVMLTGTILSCVTPFINFVDGSDPLSNVVAVQLAGGIIVAMAILRRD